MTDQYSQQPSAPIIQTRDSTLAIVSLVCGIGAYVVVPLIGCHCRSHLRTPGQKRDQK